MAAVCVAPWLLGSVYSQAQFCLAAAVAILLAVEAFHAFAYPAAIPRVSPWIAVPLAGVVILVAVQVMPLPPAIVETLSPCGAQLRAELAGDPQQGTDSLASALAAAISSPSRCVSLCPAATRQALALLAMALGAFHLGRVVTGTGRGRMWLLAATAVNGAALAFVAVAQSFSSHPLFLGFIPVGKAPFGPFVNRNNGSGYLEICLGGAIGLLLWAILRSRPAEGRPSDGYAEMLLPRHIRWQRTVIRALIRLDGPTIAAIALTACIAGGIFDSHSRGSAVATLGALLLAAAAATLGRKRGQTVAILGATAVLGAGLVMWIGMLPSVQSRLSTFHDFEAFQSRAAHWADVLPVTPKFWRLGSGLGTYAYAYGPYEQHPRDVWFYHAENQYLEVLLEAGLPGIGLLLVAAGAMALTVVRRLARSIGTREHAAAMAGTFILASQILHAAYDFALWIPANLLLMAVYCGSMAPSDAPSSGSHRRRPTQEPEGKNRWRALAPHLVWCCLGAWSCAELYRGAAAERAMQASAGLEARHSTADEVHDALDQVRQAARSLPDDSALHLRLAGLHLQLFRLEVLQELEQQFHTRSQDDLWEFTSPLVLHGALQQAAARGPAALEALRSTPCVAKNLPEALAHLVLARQANPMEPDVHLQLAALCGVVAKPGEDRLHLQRARRLGPSQQEVLLRTGVMEAQSGRRDLACADWGQSFELALRRLDPQGELGTLPFYCWPALQVDWRRLENANMKHIGRLLSLATEYVSLMELVERVLPASPQLLVDFAERDFPGEEYQRVRLILARRAREALPLATLPDAEGAWLAGRVGVLEGNSDTAIKNYRRAVSLRATEVDWRFELASLLLRAGQLPEAHEHARICVQLRPDEGKFQDLLEEVNGDLLRHRVRQ